MAAGLICNTNRFVASNLEAGNHFHGRAKLKFSDVSQLGFSDWPTKTSVLQINYSATFRLSIIRNPNGRVD